MSLGFTTISQGLKTAKAVVTSDVSSSSSEEEGKVCLPDDKVKALFFWDANGILLMGDLPKSQTINSQYSANLLWQLREKSNAERIGKLTIDACVPPG